MLLGSQEPTLRYSPPYSETHGGKCADMMERAGFPLLPWQKSVVNDWLARAGDSWVSSSSGLSICRQVGKTRLCCARIAFGMVAYGEWVVYTSHLQKTSTETFEELQSIFESPALKKFVKVVKTALGREEIVLTNGARCKFLARTRNGGRGQHGDLWVVDEAMVIDDSQQSSFLPLLSASKNPQTLYLSSPPDESADGEVFRRIRETAKAGTSTSTSWNEWGVSEIGDVSDRSRWAQVIPSLGYLIKESTVEGELEQMAPDKFARERLGWWSDASANTAIKREEWNACATDSPPESGLFSYAVKFSPDGAVGTLAVCLKPTDGVPHVEVVANRSMSGGVSWFADWIEERKSKAAQITVDGMANAQPLIDELLRRGIPQKAICKPRSADVAAACSELLNAVNEGRVTHYDQGALNESALKSKKRAIGSGGGWGFAGNNCDPTLIEACALAYWGAQTTKRNPNRKQRVGF